MNILLVTRGSQGDIYPYLILAQTLESRGHAVTLSLPRAFEAAAKNAGIRFRLQKFDDIEGMMSKDSLSIRDFLNWTRRIIVSQFDELVPLLGAHDILVAANTEFAAPSVAEYCRKPLIRTTYGPFIPGKLIPPPVMPPLPLLRPALLWKVLNTGLNLMVLKTLNRCRRALGMAAIRDQAEHAPTNADNYCMYSKYLGTCDINWKYHWGIGGYCFNDSLHYDRKTLNSLLAFINGDSRPTLFFTLGSCTSGAGDAFAGRLHAIARRHNLKLVVGCGWRNLGSRLGRGEDLYLLDTAIPHHLFFPAIDGIIHHGGAGTTHSAARAGRPQLISPLLLDQFYWGGRVRHLGIGPGTVNIKRISGRRLEKKVLDLIHNPVYRENAGILAKQIRSEQGIESLCSRIENYGPAAEDRLDA